MVYIIGYLGLNVATINNFIMSLPKPSGIFGVGCVDVMTKVNTIPDDLHPKILCQNNLGSFLRLYYPCDNSVKLDSSKKKATWLPEPNQTFYSHAFAKYIKMGNLVGWMVHMLYRNLRMDAIPNVPLIEQASWNDCHVLDSMKESKKLPLIIFSHGIGGQRAIYSVFCTQLASEGFLVAAIEHRDRSGSTTYIIDDKGSPVELPYFHDTSSTKEGKIEFMKLRNDQLEKRTDEVKAALDLLENLNTNPEDIDNCIESDSDLNMFKGRIGTGYPLMMGHSFGGATMVNALKKEPRLKCGVGLDVWFEPFQEEFFETKIEKDNTPTLLIFTEYFNFKYNMQRCYNLIKGYAKDFIEVVTLKHTRHYDQCDIPGVLPSLLTNYMNKKHQNNLPYHDAVTAQRKLISDYCWTFFQKKETSESVKLLSDNYNLEEVFMVGSPICDEKLN